jgi:hypothetical protein
MSCKKKYSSGSASFGPELALFINADEGEDRPQNRVAAKAPLRPWHSKPLLYSSQPRKTKTTFTINKLGSPSIICEPAAEGTTTTTRAHTPVDVAAERPAAKLAK